MIAELSIASCLIATTVPNEWRMLASIEGLTGIRIFGVSSAFFFIVVSKCVLQPAEETSRA
jgi:hypothetical protein